MEFTEKIVCVTVSKIVARCKNCKELFEGQGSKNIYNDEELYVLKCRECGVSSIYKNQDLG